MSLSLVRVVKQLHHSECHVGVRPTDGYLSDVFRQLFECLPEVFLPFPALCLHSIEDDEVALNKGTSLEVH